MKRSELFFGALLVPIDYLALLVAGAAAYYLRVSPWVQEVRPAVFLIDLPLPAYMKLVALMASVVLVIFALLGLYSMQVTRRLMDELTRIFAGLSMGVMLVIMYMFLSAELFQSRFLLLAAYIFGFVFVAIGRAVVRRVQRAFLRHGVGVHRVLLVGNGRYGRQLKGLFRRHPELGYRVVAQLEVVRWDALEQRYWQTGIDELVQTDPSLPEEDNLLLLDFCEKYKLDYKHVPNLFETYAPHVRVRYVGGVPMMELMRTPLDGWGRIAKRGMDAVGSAVGLVLLAPVFAATAVAVRLDSPGPVFYRQMRMGRNMKPFAIYKFRSMRLEYCLGEAYGGAEAAALDQTLRQRTNERGGPLFKMRRDPRVTLVGRFIRRWRIDELPQLINVLRGEMSLLGPRPHLPYEVAQYDKYQRRLFTLKPGISGMAQVSGNAGLSFAQEAKLDVSYIEGWSLWLDFVLLFKTFRLLLTDRNAV